MNTAGVHVISTLAAAMLITAGCDDGPTTDADCGEEGGPAVPVVDFIQPGEATTFAPGEAIHFLVKFSDADTVVSGLEITWEDSLDGVLDVPAPGEDGVAEFDWDQLGEGVHALTVTARDPDGCSGADDRGIQVCDEGDCL